MNIKIKIDVTKINKDKLFKSEKGAIYLDAVMIEKKTEYSDFMIVENSTKEERESGIKGTILGNGSYIIPKEAESLPVNDNDLPWEK